MKGKGVRQMRKIFVAVTLVAVMAFASTAMAFSLLEFNKGKFLVTPVSKIDLFSRKIPNIEEGYFFFDQNFPFFKTAKDYTAYAWYVAKNGSVYRVQVLFNDSTFAKFTSFMNKYWDKFQYGFVIFKGTNFDFEEDFYKDAYGFLDLDVEKFEKGFSPNFYTWADAGVYYFAF